MAGGMGSLVSKLLAKDEAAMQNQQPDGISLSSDGNSLFTGMPVPQAAFTIQPPGAQVNTPQNSQPLPNLAQEAPPTSANQSGSLSLDLDLGDTAPDTASTSKESSLQLSDNDASHLYPSGENANPQAQQPIAEENFFIAEHPQPQQYPNDAGHDDNNLSIAIADDDFTLNNPLGSPISRPLKEDTGTHSTGEEPLPIVDLSTGDIVDLSLDDDSASDNPPLSLEPVTDEDAFELTPLPLDKGNEIDDTSLPFLNDEQDHNLDFSISIDSDDTHQPESQWEAEAVELDFSGDTNINTTNDDWLSNLATDENQTTDDWLGSTTDTPSSTHHQHEDTEDDWLGDTSEPAPFMDEEVNAKPQNLNPSIEIAPDLFDDEVNEAPLELELNPSQSLDDDNIFTEEDMPNWLNADATSPNEVALSDKNLQEPHLEITPATDMMTPEDITLPNAEIASYPTIEPLIISSEDVAQYYPEDDELADVGQPVSSIMLPDSDDDSVFDEFDNTTQLNVASTSQSKPSLQQVSSETAGNHNLPDSPLALLEPFHGDDDWNLSLPTDMATPQSSTATTTNLNGNDDFVLETNFDSTDSNLDGFSDSFSLTLPDELASQSADLPSTPIETSKTRPDMLDLPVWLTNADDATASLEGNDVTNSVTPQPNNSFIESEQNSQEFPSLGFDDEDAVDLFDDDELISNMADEQADTETALPATSSPIAAAHEPQPETATTHENILFKKQLTDTLMVRVVSQPDGVVALIAHDNRHQTPKTLRQLPKGMVPGDAIITAGKDMRLRSCTIYRIEIGHWTGLFGQDDASGELSFRDEILMD